MVVCDDNDESDFYINKPTLIVEVISRSTRKADEQIKRVESINIPNLQEYVLIEQDYVDIAVFERTDSRQPTHYFLGDEVSFESIGLTIPVAEVYQRV